MIAPLTAWTARGKWSRISPCGKYQISKVYIAGLADDRYYAYPRPTGAKCGGPFVEADDAHAACVEHAGALADGVTA